MQQHFERQNLHQNLKKLHVNFLPRSTVIARLHLRNSHLVSCSCLSMVMLERVFRGQMSFLTKPARIREEMLGLSASSVAVKFHLRPSYSFWYFILAVFEQLLYFSRFKWTRLKQLPNWWWLMIQQVFIEMEASLLV